jgi:hypothetical protein
MSRQWRDRQKIHAVHKRDTEEILRDLGLLERLQDGQERCCICGRTIAVDQVQCLLEREGTLLLCCTQMSCYEQVLSEQGDRAA